MSRGVIRKYGPTIHMACGGEVDTQNWRPWSTSILCANCGERFSPIELGRRILTYVNGVLQA